MNQKQLTYFMAIAEEGNITKAAKRLFIPEPYLSNQLKKIEQELDVKLAVRSTRKLQLTDAGKRFQFRAAQMLEMINSIKMELKDFESGQQGTLAIGTVSTSVAILLSRSIPRFHQKFPNIKFEIRDMSTQSIQAALRIGTIEVGIVRTPFDTTLFDSFSLPKQPMIAVSNTEYKNDKSILQIIELSGLPLLVSYRFGPIIVEACHAAGFTPNIVCKVDDTRFILTWANSGMGIAVIPKDWIDIMPGLNLHYREIDAPSLITSPNIIWLKTHTLSSVAQNFIDFFSEQLSDKSYI